jgi:hypothetical protein
LAEAKPTAPWVEALGKLVLYIGVPVGVLVAIYAIVTKLITGGGAAFIDLYKVQLDAYIKKMDRYAKENNGVLNAAQQASREDEQKAMNQTLGNAAQAYGTPWGLITAIAAAVLTVFLGVYVLKQFPSIYQKWKPLFEKPETQPRTGKSAAIMCECVLVDTLAAQGMLTTATNYLTTLQTMWSSIDAPYMQSEVANLQAQIDAGVLTGIHLQIAQYMVQAYTFELAVMPSILTLPLVGV